MPRLIQTSTGSLQLARRRFKGSALLTLSHVRPTSLSRHPGPPHDVNVVVLHGLLVTLGPVHCHIACNALHV